MLACQKGVWGKLVNVGSTAVMVARRRFEGWTLLSSKVVLVEKLAEAWLELEHTADSRKTHRRAHMTVNKGWDIEGKE